jgi:hypothetical protein
VAVDGVKSYTFTPNANSSVARRGSERVVLEQGGFVCNLDRGVKYLQLIVKGWRLGELNNSLVN